MFELFIFEECVNYVYIMIKSFIIFGDMNKTVKYAFGNRIFPFLSIAELPGKDVFRIWSMDRFSRK
jgi:hypothetical protein